MMIKWKIKYQKNYGLKQCAQAPIISIILHIFNTKLLIFASFLSFFLFLKHEQRYHAFFFLLDDLVPFDEDTNMQDLEDTKNDDIDIDQKEVKIKKNRKLSWEEVSQYFSMPIEAAAGELDMCLTSLKGNCRQLGLKRWPHRKIRSLQNLIKYIQVLSVPCKFLICQYT